jgi:hypothetical protein
MLDEKAFLVSKKKKRPIFVAKKEYMDKKIKEALNLKFEKV